MVFKEQFMAKLTAIEASRFQKVLASNSNLVNIGNFFEK